MYNLILQETKKNRIIIGIKILIFCNIIYLVSNSLTMHLLTPVYLKMLPIDNSIPLVPTTILIYLSEMPLCLMTILLVRNPIYLCRYFCALLLASFLALMLFILIPISFPYMNYALPSNTNGVIAQLFLWVRSSQSPTNSFPSIHVCFSFLSAFVFLYEQEKKFLFILVWAIAIMISTLTTKQHYFIDIPAGFLLACLCHLFWVYKIPTPSYNNSIEYRRANG